MARILIGNVKHPLVNNGLTTEVGKYALDAAYGKALTDKDTELASSIAQLNSDFNNINHTGVESLNFYNDNGNIGIIFSINSSEQYQVVFYISGSIKFFRYDGSNWAGIWEVTA